MQVFDQDGKKKNNKVKDLQTVTDNAFVKNGIAHKSGMGYCFDSSIPFLLPLQAVRLSRFYIVTSQIGYSQSADVT